MVTVTSSCAEYSRFLWREGQSRWLSFIAWGDEDPALETEDGRELNEQSIEFLSGFFFLLFLILLVCLLILWSQDPS